MKTDVCKLSLHCQTENCPCGFSSSPRRFFLWGEGPNYLLQGTYLHALRSISLQGFLHVLLNLTTLSKKIKVKLKKIPFREGVINTSQRNTRKMTLQIWALKTGNEKQLQLTIEKFTHSLDLT